MDGIADHHATGDVVYREVEGDSIFVYWRDGWKNALNFSGRARREEWWTFWFSNSFLWIPISVFLQIVQSEIVQDVLQWGIAIPFVVSTASLTVRRVHDFGKGAAFALVAFIPILGLFLLLRNSDRGPNKYGPSPKYATPWSANGAVTPTGS